MALLLTAVAVMPALGAVTGAITVDKTFVAPSGTVTVSVTDADLNVTTAATNYIDGGIWDSSGKVVFLNLKDSWNQTGADFGSSTTAAGDEVTAPVLVARNLNGGYTNVLSDFSVSVFDADLGKIRVEFGGASGTQVTQSMTFSYKIAGKETATVTITSPSDATGITVSLAETGASTGKYSGTFDVTGGPAVASNQAEGNILAVAGQDVTIKYTDASPSVNTTKTVRVESNKPVGSLVSPANKSTTTSLTPKLKVEFTDLDAKVNNGTFAFVIAEATKTGNVAAAITVGTATTKAITNGYSAEVTIDASAHTGETISIDWYATVDDKAGNTGQTDADATVTGNQNYKLIIDKQAPNFTGATFSAGAWWNAETSKAETDVTKSIPTSIGIKMPLALDLNTSTDDIKESLVPGTVTVADFEIDSLKKANGAGTVNDIAPTAVNVYAAAPEWIFLTVPAMAPDAAPKVSLKSTSGGLSDAAGNATSAAVTNKVITDRQAPTVTYALNRTLNKKDFTLTITTNEAGGVPVVTIESASSVSASPISQSVTLAGTNIYESKIAPTFGMHSVKITVTDTASNETILGGVGPKTDWATASGAIGLYMDDNVPAPTVTVNGVTASGASVEASEPFFITAAFTGEKKEYGLTTGGTVTADAAAVVTDLDTQNTVTLATATLDGVDILTSQDTQDNSTFTFAMANVAKGAHKLVLAAKDEAGNAVTTGTINFTVTARKAYSVAMSAGWNLISLPGTPVDGAIGSVLSATHPATDVLSYDDGVWSVASRVAGGVWEGTLTTIDGNHGYWVNTSSSAPVTSLLSLTSVGSAATLPTIAIEPGWNLVSVIDLAQTKQGDAAATKTGAVYFTSVSWSVAYSYDATTRAWTRVTSTSGNVSNGTGVWVWATKAGTLIP